MNTRTLLGVGVTGTVIAALCCFTPVLVILLGVIGLSAWAGVLDYVLLPALAIFAALALYALKRRRSEAACCAPGSRRDAHASEGPR